MPQRTRRSLETVPRVRPLPSPPLADEYIRGAILSLQSALMAYRSGRARDALSALEDARRGVVSARLKLNEERNAR